MYGLVSKAYSHPSIRLKKYPVSSWLIAGLFQGWFTLLIVYMGLHDSSPNSVFDPEVQFAAVLSSVILWGSYPMTQIYQHKEDAGRGDTSLSIKLGIPGTFHFTAFCFLVATIGFILYYQRYESLTTGIMFVLFMSPVVIYFGYWYLKVRKDRSLADFDHTMRLNFISSLALNLFFGLVALGLN